MSRLGPHRIAVPVGLLALWWALALSGIWPAAMFPSPAAVAAYLATGIRNGSLFWGAVASFTRLLAGFGVSIITGVALGILVARSRRLSESLSGIVFGLQTLPSVCWLPLAVLWFKSGEPAILFVVVMGALPTIAATTWTAIHNVPPLLLRAGRTLGAEGAAIYVRVIFPAAFPAMLAGSKQGWNFAWRSLMAAELLDVDHGLGYLLLLGRKSGDVAALFGVILVIIMIGSSVDYLVFRRLERWVRKRWGYAESA